MSVVPSVCDSVCDNLHISRRLQMLYVYRGIGALTQSMQIRSSGIRVRVTRSTFIFGTPGLYISVMAEARDFEFGL